ncbi:MAG: PIN domain-containing protein [Kiritimatiellae bacterium]|nr:PIN domain-containing protein [Kiritimatiellia bacterium]
MTFIDTNVFVYFVDGRNREKQSIARAVLTDAIGSRQYVISAQVLNEFANVSLKKLGMTEDEVRQYIEAFQHIQVVFQQLGCTVRALELRKQYGLQFYDALLLAAAESAGCDKILTEDLNDGQVYCGITAENPFK